MGAEPSVSLVAISIIQAVCVGAVNPHILCEKLRGVLGTADKVTATGEGTDVLAGC